MLDIPGAGFLRLEHSEHGEIFYFLFFLKHNLNSAITCGAFKGDHEVNLQQ